MRGGGSRNLARPGVGTGEAAACGVRNGRLFPGVGRVRFGVDNLGAADVVSDDKDELDRSGVTGLCGCTGTGILGDGGGVGRDRGASIVSLVGWLVISGTPPIPIATATD